ncbi:MAG: hypothetical protein ABI205_06830 [Gemmatimonadaceae bacterium]
MANGDAKWIDNLLSHFNVPGVAGGRQGVARHLSQRGIFHVALIRRLSTELGVGTAFAVSLAGQLLDTDATHVDLGEHMSLRFDRAAFLHEIERATRDAAESVAPARRGRPPSPRSTDPEP